MENTLTISEIIKAAGGATAIATASAGAIKKDAVYKWPSIGIPDRHWSVIMQLAPVSPEQLYAANVLARSASGVAA
ncbi:MAG: carph-isopro domain-containing protein [Phyllobacterium sp.]